MPETQSAGQHAREYETIYILRPDVARDNQEKVAARLSEAVSREGAKLTSIENWGRRQLAYPVKKCKRGVYVYLKYVGGGAAVNEVERNLRMLDDVIKYQTVQVREDIDASTLSVNADELKFEAVEPPGDDEQEATIEQILGFAESPDRPRQDGEGLDEEADDFGVPDEDDQ